ncbi:MAG: UPF0280 family protein [Deltaproteobacteria bacterium]|jgi:ApbE superfamily uncharacterized protein (UPF0280 family)|nr:UPF0280 family protein [Deltaproteobacteria bacterium]
MKYQERTYRNKICNKELQAFHVSVRETDLFILADHLLSDLVSQSVYKYREYIESYIKYHPHFLTSLVPLEQDNFAPDIVRDMLKAAEIAKVGPMAAVAGAIAEYVGQDILLHGCRNVVVENGGDIFLKTEQEVTVGVYAGESPLSYKVRILIKPEQMPLGVCTSSGTVGHSLSLGRADAVCVLSHSVSVADAAATAIGNLVRNKNDIKKALAWGLDIKEVSGILIISGDQLGVQGNIELA